MTERFEADISDCGTYRYALWRLWGKWRFRGETRIPSLPPVWLWIMLNPSTAGAEKDDPTICAVREFTKRGGGEGFCVMNLSPYRATNPNELKKLTPDVFRGDHGWASAKLWSATCAADKVMVAWGAHGARYQWQVDHVLATLNAAGMAPYCLDVTKSGQPRHPLYVRRDTVPKVWERPAT